MDTIQTDQELFEKEFNTNGKLSIDEMIGIVASYQLNQPFDRFIKDAKIPSSRPF